ncbi:hypothetical protein ODZ84_19720 [Chryseobacterium fluminis]|uniref:hypothetical protein n=1 Tax=Chryseobacterium fluminis TaxID=2983606 RepID=UPI0022556872|nr:hypothetical protein [Chryseobacterium sp. MMS21-Ot14]UZT97390.1 hypothetical protein ODZ84_19720 [Chryseobacterium sp. MMS21-Ot14]
MKLKIFVILFLFSGIFHMNAQQKIYTIDEIGWQLTVPDGFKIIPEPKKPVKKSPSGRVEKMIFKNDRQTSLSILYINSPQDESTFKEHIEIFEQNFIQEIKKKASDIYTEKTISEEKFQGLDFHKSAFKFEGGNDTKQYFIFYFAQIGQRYVVFNIIAGTDEEADKMMKVFENESRFE